jgi:hypothetical protein
LALATPTTPASPPLLPRSALSADGSFFVSLRCEKQKTPTGQTEAKTMEYQSNHNSNSASAASNGSTRSIASNPAYGRENRKPATAQQTNNQRQTAQQMIAANVKSLIEQLEAGHSDALTAYLDAMSRFHNYSFGNVLEIARQKAVT